MNCLSYNLKTIDGWVNSFAISDNVMFMPQKDNFPYYLFRTGIDTIPTGFTVAGVCLHVVGILFL